VAAPPAEARLAGDGAWAVIRVDDTGIGIAPDKLERIFQPFEQGESGYTRQHSGTGLGLTISRRLARLMGGELTVQSTPGEGSSFSLWLPRAASRATDGPRRDDATAPQRPTAAVAPTDEAASDGALATVGEALRRDLDPIIRRYVARMRGDASLPNVTRLSDLQLQDHAATWIADVAQGFSILHEAGVEPVELMRDGSAIQHLIAERHGAQRYRLGWDESALEREFALLREVLESELGARLSDRGAAAHRARELLARFVAQAEQVSRRALRHAAQTTTARPTPSDSASPV